MADKSQTINILYKFNTADIDKAAQSLAKVNAASNKVQADAAKGASAFTKEYNNSGKSVADLQRALTGLKSALEATPKGQTQRIAQLKTEYAGFKKQLDDTTKSMFGFNKATTQTGQGVKSLVTEFKNLSQIAGLGILAGIAKEAVDLTLSMSTLQGQVEGVERGFNRAFINPLQVLSEVREATQGTITDFDLMKRTLQATNLGVSVEHLGTLFEFAAARAQQTGESVDYLVDSIVRGIGRKSPLVLDNLGISVTALKEKFDGASIASKSVAEATEGVAEIAKEQLEKMGGFVKTAETEVKQLTTAWENLRINLARKIEASGVIGFFTDVANGLSALTKSGEVIEKEQAKQLASERLAAIMRDDIFKDRKNNQLAQLDLMTQEMLETQKLIRVKGQEIEAFEKAKEAAEKNIRTDEFGNVVAQESVTWREKAIDGLKRSKSAYEELLPLMKNAIRVMQSEMELNDSSIISLEKLNAERDRILQHAGGIEGKDIKSLLDNEELQKDAKDLQKVNAEIKAINDLLNPPKDKKTLKVKVEVDQSDLERLLASIKFIQEGGTLKGKQLNPGSALTDAPLLEHDQAAIDATEVLDQKTLDAIDEDTREAADHVANGFWARFRLAMKREGGDSSELQQDFQDALIDLQLASVDILADQMMSLADREADILQLRIRRLKEFYDEQYILAGDNERAKDELRLREERQINKLRKRQFDAEKKAAKQKALIDGAAAIVKTFVSYGGFTPAALIAVALQAAATASQIAIIDRQAPRFAKGVIDIKGRGTGTSDSIPAHLSKGESVMTAWETRNSGGILRDIRAKKLDDRVLRNIREGRAPVQGMSDQGIIKAIKENRAPDVIEQSGIVYKATKKSDDYISKQRAKSVRI